MKDKRARDKQLVTETIFLISAVKQKSFYSFANPESHAIVSQSFDSLLREEEEVCARVYKVELLRREKQ